jgi:hypothetical protein
VVSATELVNVTYLEGQDTLYDQPAYKLQLLQLTVTDLHIVVSLQGVEVLVDE